MLRSIPVLLVTGLSLPAQEPKVSFVDAFPEQIALDRPVHLDHHPVDPAVFYVVTQPGRIHRIARDPGVAETQTFLDWTRRTLAQPEFNDRSNGAGWEEGLLGFAFDPDFEDDRYVYIYYTEKTGERERRRRGRTRTILERQSVVSRLRWVQGEHGPEADPESELRILEVPQPFGNHNGGTILFGPDDMLYIVLGDGGAANDPYGNAQDRTTLLGSILRIDVREASEEEPYRIPDDNPFAGEGGGVRGEIWAYGLRNPWRISFDEETGALWCADVGQNAWEEVDIIVKGGNYGWNHKEGFEDFDLRRQEDEAPDDLIDPILVYPRSEGISITGGHVYRGSDLRELEGMYVYGDFDSRRVWAVERPPEGERAEPVFIGIVPDLLASWAETPDGELLALCFDGRIYRMAPPEDEGR